MKYQYHPFERNYMKVTIELEPDQIDTLVKADLRSLLDCLESDLERVKEDQKGYVFESDWQKDAKEIEGHIRAFRKVLRYYGEDLQECVDETAKHKHELTDWEAVAQPEQEPFGYFRYDLALEGWQETGTDDGKPLYTAPPKREWVGLTDKDFYGQSELQMMAMKYAEAKLKEKNLG
jgi:hypothetical protein